MVPFQSEGTVDGNAQVIALLERWLERAKLGQLNYIAASICEGPIHVYHDFAGCFGMEFAANWGLDVLKQRLMASQANREPAERDKKISADRFCWLSTKGPACFDFVIWLVMAEMERMYEGAPAPLKVGFFWGKDGQKDRILQTANRRLFYDNVIIPSLALIGAVEDPSCVENGRIMERYTTIDIVRNCRLGQDVPVFTPSEKAIEAVRGAWGDPAPVTITLREASYSSHRNSNLDEWLKFAEYLTAQGERVVFIRDTKNAGESIPGYETCAVAAIDLDVRLALYEQAKCNCFVGNGPWALALFGTKPWLCFVEINAMDPYTPNTDQWWRTFQGIGQGEQFPWCRPDQRIVWGRDTFPVMSRAWEELEPLLSLRRAAE